MLNVAPLNVELPNMTINASGGTDCTNESVTWDVSSFSPQAPQVGDNGWYNFIEVSGVQYFAIDINYLGPSFAPTDPPNSGD